MGLWGSIVSDIKPTLTDWLTVRGGQVSDLPLLLINRGRKMLWMHTAWDFLVTELTLTLNTLHVATLPSDFGSIIAVYHDQNADGTPDWYYYRNDKRYDRCYKMSMVGSNTVAPVVSLTFSVAPPVPPVLVYQKSIENVTADAHYLIFPDQLVLRAAQMCHIIDKNLNGNEISAIVGDYNVQLKDFKEKCQYNNCAMDMLTSDNMGSLIETESYTLDGQMGSFASGRDRSYDSGR